MLALLSDLGCINIQGVDSVKFLQGQLTCHVGLLAPNESCLGAHCNPQGRVLSLFYLFRFEDSYQLIMQRDMVPIAIAALKKYAVFFKVQLSDASDEYLFLGGNHDTTEPVAKDSSSGLIPVDEVRSLVIGKKSRLAHLPCSTSLDEWHAANINNLIPTIYPKTSGIFLPHEINLDLLNAIHFEKGCYTGQEIIARMHYRGKIKNRLYKASVNSSIILGPGVDIYTAEGEDYRVASTIVDAAKNGYNKYDLLIIANEATMNSGLFLTADKNTLLTVYNQKANI